MKPVLWALAMTVCYAASNVIIERKLASASTLPLMVFNYLVLLTMSFAVLMGRNMAAGTTAELPTGSLYAWIALWAVIVLIADFCFFRAYHSGGSVVLVTMLIIMIPLFAILIKAATGAGWPSSSQWAAIPFAATAIYLATRG